MQVDPFASALKAGERPDCNGLVLVVGWCWGSQDEGYQRLAAELSSLDDSHTLVYAGEYTHCTCATLSRYAGSEAAQKYILLSQSFSELGRIRDCPSTLHSSFHSAEQFQH